MDTAPQRLAPVSIFYSYAHKDESLRDELDTHLALLQRTGLLSEWHDRQIQPGRHWAEEISAHIEHADLILLLVSADFIASDYCWSQEMTRALERHKAGEARVVPIILRPVDWQIAPFATLQALPTNATPVTSWPDRDAAWTDVAKGIRRVIEGTAAEPLPSRSADSRRSGEWTTMAAEKVLHDHSVSIGGQVTGSVIVTGNRNVVTLDYQHVSLPPATSVDIRAELEAIRVALMGLATPDRRKIENALTEAQDEVAKVTPEKEEVGKTLERALEYAQKAEGFARSIETLKPHVINAGCVAGEKLAKTP